MCILKLNVINNWEKYTQRNLIEQIDVVIPYIRTVYEISETDLITISAYTIKLKEIGITPDRDVPQNYADNFANFPYFNYETTQGEIKTLVFKDIETARKARELLLQSVDTFFKNYTQYVTTLK